ncbi:hypothetical protein RI367_001271 [Sorochytrium milnesiophthora]
MQVQLAAQGNEDSQDVRMLRAAIDLAHKSTPSPAAYCVGALVVNASGQILATGYSRELPGNTHAEEVCLLKLGAIQPGDAGGSSDVDLSGCTLYTTMEPCSTRTSGRPSCTQNIIISNTGLRRIVVGIMEPPDFVNCTGVETLQQAGYKLVHVTGLEEACWLPNQHIRPHYSSSSSSS